MKRKLLALATALALALSLSVCAFAAESQAPTSIQCKDGTLTYTYRFDKAVQDVHQAGTYTFVVDLATGNVTQTAPGK